MFDSAAYFVLFVSLFAFKNQTRNVFPIACIILEVYKRSRASSHFDGVCFCGLQ